MLDLAFNFFSTYLIEIMGGILLFALGLRVAIFKSSKVADSYFSTFTREIDKVLARYQNGDENIGDVDAFLNDLFSGIEEKLPKKSVRHKSSGLTKSKVEELGARNVVSFRDFAQSEDRFLHSLQNESGIFKSTFPPNFDDVADRILEQDNNWNKLFKFLPIEALNRFIDVLPGIFVVLGIFGTFIGISMALPGIATIDFSNIEGSGGVLSSFVLNVTFAMKTSIAGILFSLIMTFLNTLAPVHSLRDRAFKRISNCFENIWHTIHGESKSEDQIDEVLNQFKLLRRALVENNKNHVKKAG
ncbi:MAG: hypothetical protein HOE90_24700 [Bacteriovoracaceae bacterium]|nr:hypothetical protein [Bacteriovoracaceae bacterium]